MIVDPNHPHFDESLTAALSVAVPIARHRANQASGADFLLILIELLRELLPIILKLFEDKQAAD